MLALHQSQKKWLDESQGLDSYIHTMHRLDEEVGRMSRVFAAAEGWRRHLHLGFAGANDDPLRDALGKQVFARRSTDRDELAFRLLLRSAILD